MTTDTIGTVVKALQARHAELTEAYNAACASVEDTQAKARHAVHVHFKYVTDAAERVRHAMHTRSEYAHYAAVFNSAAQDWYKAVAVEARCISAALDNAAEALYACQQIAEQRQKTEDILHDINAAARLYTDSTQAHDSAVFFLYMAGGTIIDNVVTFDS